MLKISITSKLLLAAVILILPLSGCREDKEDTKTEKCESGVIIDVGDGEKTCALYRVDPKN